MRLVQKAEIANASECMVRMCSLTSLECGAGFVMSNMTFGDDDVMVDRSSLILT